MTYMISGEILMKKFLSKAAPYAVFAACGLSFNLLYSWAVGRSSSVGSILLDVLLFVCSASLIATLIRRRVLPAALVRALDRLAGKSPMSLLRGVGVFVSSYPLLILGLVSIVVWGRSAPAVQSLPATAQAMYSAANLLGMGWFVFNMVAITFSPSRVVTNGVNLVEKFILYILVLVFIRVFGAELAEGVELAKSNPDGALAVVAAFVLLRVAFSFAPNRQSPYVVARGAAMMGRADQIRRPRLPADLHRTAVHEAGHLILFGARGEWPSDLTVNVLSEVGPDDIYRGQVVHARPESDTLTESALLWSMRMRLAGGEAERITFGERADGGSGDNDNWLTDATAYLLCGFGEVFYANPATTAQREHNRVVLNGLKGRCMDDARALLEANREVLDELAAAILESKVMHIEALTPFLSRVAKTASEV